MFLHELFFIFVVTLEKLKLLDSTIKILLKHVWFIENSLQIFVLLNDLWELRSQSGLKILFYILAILKYETLYSGNFSFEVLSRFFWILFDALNKAFYLTFLSLDFLFSELD